MFPRFYPILPRGGTVDIHFSESDSPAERSFLADLILFYAFDLGDHFELVSNSARRELQVSEEDLHSAAVQNMRALELKIECHDLNGACMLSAGGNFEATLLLLPELWESEQFSIPPDVVVSVPARDILLFSSCAPGDITQLRRLTSRAIEKAEKPLSRHFFTRRNGDWCLYRGYAE